QQASAASIRQTDDLLSVGDIDACQDQGDSDHFDARRSAAVPTPTGQWIAMGPRYPVRSATPTRGPCASLLNRTKLLRDGLLLPDTRRQYLLWSRSRRSSRPNGAALQRSNGFRVPR